MQCHRNRKGFLKVDSWKTKTGLYNYNYCWGMMGTRNIMSKISIGITTVLSLSTLIAIFLINVIPKDYIISKDLYVNKRVPRSIDKSYNKPSNGSLCFSNSSTIRNSSWFECPEPGQNLDMTSCCGKINDQICCKPKIENGNTEDDDVSISKEDIITTITVLVGFVVIISLCMVLYCCCCQRRPEVQSGKVVFRKRKKKNKDEENDIQLETQLIDQEQNHTNNLLNGEKLTDARKARSHECLHPDSRTTSPKRSHSKQEITVPLINIQASTPTDPDTCSQ